MAAAHSPGGDTAIIDLGLGRGEPESYRAPTRRTTSVWFGPALVTAIVLLCTGASAAPGPPPLHRLFGIAIGPADGFTVTADGRLVAQSLGSLRSYDLTTGEQRWSAAPTAQTFRLRTGNGLILLRPWTSASQVTTAVSIATGETKWRHPGTVLTVAGSDTLLSTASVRTAAGPARRVQGPIEALDPESGVVRWRIDVPSTAVMIGVPGAGDLPARLLLVHDNRTATLHDLATGAELITAPMPAADYGPDNPTVSGGVILLRHPGVAGSEVSAYDPVTLRQRWTIPTSRAFEVQPCGALACLAGPEGMRAVDPADGTPLWSRAGWRRVETRGELTLAYGSPVGTAYPFGLIEPASGELVTDLTGWRPLPGPEDADHLLLTRALNAGAPTLVAVAAPGDRRPRLLADLPPGTGDCQTAPNRLVCRTTAGELVVWAHRGGR